ncbi:MAG: bifunctional oligoribonuclease/PAP phosphatase NrnA [Clostridiales bacterium]|nr:bifunctional oligoribonuclease/PAP phosphatase NrnA [Clostridiales bacterium]
MNCTLEEIANRIKKAKSVAIFTHMRPDGDAFGSSLSLACAVRALGLQAEVCVETEIPSNLRFLNGIDEVKRLPETEYDLLITVDCSELTRLGALTDEFGRAMRKNVDTINIDHHISNTRYAKYNYVRECSANCMNVASLIAYMGAPLDKKTAEYLLVGLLTDSGNFAHDDVNSETLSLAAKLVDAGADIRYYHYNLFKKQPKARATLFAATMGGIRYFFDDRFAVITITQDAMKKCGADNGMTEGFVDFPLNVDGVEVAASIMEVKYRQYKISLRSKEYADVNKIAGTFGGGGHVRAAGCMLFGDLEEVVDRLSYAVSQYLD